MDQLTLPGVADVRAAEQALAGRVRRTPVLPAPGLAQLVGGPLLAKLESLQLTGSFKVRGALNRVLTLPAEQVARGLLTVSAGNAALGAAHAAAQVGAALTVVMPETAVAEKVAAVRGYGARVLTEGVVGAAGAFELAARLQRDEGLTFVHPFDDPMVVAGAATATLELLTDFPDVERVIVPTSGGGLLAGAVLAAAATDRPVQVVGAQPAGSRAMAASLVAGAPVTESAVTVADGLIASRPGNVTFAIIHTARVPVLTVPDEEILVALRLLVRELRVVLEPSAAVGLAALLAGHLPPGPVTGLLLTGSNVSYQLLADVLAG